MVITPDKDVAAMSQRLQEAIERGHAKQKAVNDQINDLKDKVRVYQNQIREINSSISPIAKAKSALMWAHGIEDEGAKNQAISKAMNNANGLLSSIDI